MDYYQGVVTDYLRADRAMFLNMECCIQVNPGENPDSSGPHWYCDAVAADFANERVFLCEVSYARNLGALLRRLSEWSGRWGDVRAALVRDCRIPRAWPVRPWLFIPQECVARAVAELRKMVKPDAGEEVMPVPLITTLEMVAPWKYASWSRKGEKVEEKPGTIPAEMRT